MRFSFYIIHRERERERDHSVEVSYVLTYILFKIHEAIVVIGQHCPTEYGLPCVKTVSATIVSMYILIATQNQVRKDVLHFKQFVLLCKVMPNASLSILSQLVLELSHCGSYKLE